MRTPPPNRPKGAIKNLRPILRYLKPYKKQVAIASVALIFTSSAVLGMGSGLRYLIDEGLAKGDENLLNRAFEILVAVTLLLAAASYVRFYYVSSIGERVIADIRRDVYNHLVHMHVGFFETTRTGELLSRLTTDTTLLQTVIGSSVSIAARNSLLLIGGFGLLLATSAELTGYLIFMVPLVVAPIIILGRKVRALARQSQEKVADISAHAEESLSAIRTLQSLALENYDKQRFAAQVDASLAIAMGRIKTRAFLTALVITLVFGAIVMVLWFGGKGVLAGTITAGDLSAFVFYSVVVAGAVGAISEVVADLQRAAGAAERIGELLEMVPEIVSPLKPSPSGRWPSEGYSHSTGASGRPHPNLLPEGEGITVRFDHVTFFYPTRADKPSVIDFTLEVVSGKTIALVGPSGAGKTTIFQLLQRFYDSASGAIYIDGVNVKQWPLDMLRGAIGLVPQDPMIFSDTARANIRLGDIHAGDDQIIEAAKAASAYEFIEKLPQGLDTYLGEKGVQLSGGQRQRIAIARAIIRNPKILLLDEATSALDSENEYYIQKALEHVMLGRTTFVIAHRLSTIIKADQIVLMNAGSIEAIGTHHELLQKSSLYARLAELQFKKSVGFLN